MPPRKSATKKTTTVTLTTATKSHKRQLSETSPATATPGSRASKRIKESEGKATPTKSKYFEDSDSENEDVKNVENESVSGYDDASDSTGNDPLSAEEDSEDEEEYDSSDEEVKPRKRKPVKKGESSTGAIGAVVNAVIEKGQELWRAGVKTGLGPGKQVIIEKPKPRGDGGVKYVGERIHPNTMAFLKDLKANNEREWLKSKWLESLCCWV